MARERYESISCPSCGGTLSRRVLLDEDGTEISATPWSCESCDYAS